MEYNSIRARSGYSIRRQNSLTTTGSVRKTLRSTTTLECKQLSKEIQNFDPVVWRDRASILCEPGISAKFEQNPNLLNLLKSTGNKCIVECAYDRLWGCGIPLNEENCFEEAEWSGDNLLGKILMRIRARNTDIIGNNTNT